MNNAVKPIIELLISLGALIFAYAIIQAGLNSLNEIPNLHSFLSNAAIIIGGILSTNLGAVLGFTFKPPSSATGNPPDTHNVRFLGLRSSLPPDNQAITSNNSDTSQKFQIIACWVYIIGLIVAALFYLITIINEIPEDKVVRLIPELSQTLIGVIFGAITVALGRNQQR